MFDNSAYGAFDLERFRPTNPSGRVGTGSRFNPRTLGFGLYSSLSTPPNDNIDNIKDLLKSVVLFYTELSDLRTNAIPHNKYRVLQLDHYDIGLLDFNLSMEKKNKLIEAAKAKTLEFYADKQMLLSLENPSFIHRKLVQETQLVSLPQMHPHFTGRESYFELLSKKLLENDRNPFSAAFLCANSGSGKRETALGFAHHYRESFV